MVVSGEVEAAPSAKVGGPARWSREASAAGHGDSEEVELRDEVRDKYSRLGEISLYEILGVERNATPAQVKRAYIKAAKRLHPDAL